ncbi:MAG: hypothetical protein ACI9OE_002139 [Mariniflexile sp.]|jgi:hypothetical protein
MKLGINLSTLKVGGGQNVALNFLMEIHKKDLSYLKELDLFFFVANGSASHQFLADNGYCNFKVLSSNPILRILYELFCSGKLIKIEKIKLIYSYFGFGLFPKKTPQIIGSVDSNLYYPEIDFWSDYKGISKIKKRLIDRYRLFGVKRANSVVFENKSLENRSIDLFKLQSTKTILPSINFDYGNELLELSLKIDKETPVGLFLCGWHFNKNIQIIPALANELKLRKIPFHFVITADKNDKCIERDTFMKLVNEYDVTNMISVIGNIPKSKLASLYNKIDFVFLLSKLESFSNNIIEAWLFKKILIVTDMEWSREICKEAATYVDRDSISDIVQKIQALNNIKLKNKILENGKKELVTYPSISERIQEEIKYLNEYYKNN